jgi:thiosulfate dehydrogenase [quinone] large subunit
MSRELEVELLGRKSSLEYSEHGLGYALLGLRLVMAWTFIQAGLEKILASSWSSTGFLQGVPEANPFYSMFQFFAMYPGVVDPLVMYGQVLIGLGLLLGALFRFSALMGGLQMILFWLASFQAGFMAGLPVEHGFIVNSNLVYAAILFGLGALGAGRLIGLDEYLEESSLVEKNSWLKYLLG